MISDRQFAAAHGKLALDGGFSIDGKKGTAPKDGAMIAVKGSPERVVPSKTSSPADVRRFAQDNSGALAAPGAHLGGWRHKGNDYFDVSERIGPKKSVTAEYGREVANADAITTASDLGIARGEKAVFAVGRGKDKQGKDVKALG